MVKKLIIILVVFGSALSFLGFKYYKQGTGIKIGNNAPDIELYNPDGKLTKLSSLKGHYVILDFWASWCGPCRRENPSLVRIYKNYSTKKFDNGSSLAIYSISLDKNKNSWMAAIKSDQLEWQDHVCDFMGWNSRTAAVFGVETIPANFILDGEGKIIAKDLMDGDLDKFLAAHVKK